MKIFENLVKIEQISTKMPSFLQKGDLSKITFCKLHLSYKLSYIEARVLKFGKRMQKKSTKHSQEVDDVYVNQFVQMDE